MSTTDFDEVWGRIVEHAGQPFTQVRGRVFQYTVRSSSLTLSTTNQVVGRSQFERALKLVPLESPSQIKNLRAPSYVYAILMDSRVRKQDW